MLTKIMGIRSKVKSFIRDDRPAKLKSFLSSHDVDPCEISLSGKRNLLHYCAEHGSVDMMRCLLRLECDPMCQDKDGRLPLHIALHRCLQEDVHKAKQTYEDIVSLLLQQNPLSQDVEDKDGTTSHDLLVKLKKKLKSGQSMKANNYGEGNSVDDEEEWRKKMARETQYEWEEEQPRYCENEDYSDQEEPEDFSSWSERLLSEYMERRQRQGTGRRRFHSNSRKRPGFGHPDEDTGKKKHAKQDADQEEELRKAREEMRKNYKPPCVEESKCEQLLVMKGRYEKRFNDFCHSPPPKGKVTFASVPWPCTNMEKLVNTLFCDLPDKRSDAYRKYLKREQVRWHPDKFSQKFQDLLHPDHVHKIMGRVKAISQTLNALAS